MYKDQQMAFAQFATDPKDVFNVWPEYKIDPEQLKAFQSDRQACVADRRLAERMKWKIGERIPLQGTFYTFNLDLKLVGLFDAPQNTDSLWFDWSYLDEGLKAQSSEMRQEMLELFSRKRSMHRQWRQLAKRSMNASPAPTTQLELRLSPRSRKCSLTWLAIIQVFILIIGLAVVFLFDTGCRNRHGDVDARTHD